MVLVLKVQKGQLSNFNKNPENVGKRFFYVTTQHALIGCRTCVYAVGAGFIGIEGMGKCVYGISNVSFIRQPFLNNTFGTTGVIYDETTILREQYNRANGRPFGTPFEYQIKHTVPIPKIPVIEKPSWLTWGKDD
jgi:hypothetical protein